MSDGESSSEESTSREEQEVQESVSMPTLPPVNPTDGDYLKQIREHNEYLASLRKELRLLVIRNPHLKPFEESELDKKLKVLTKDELESILENVKTDLGLVKPCVAGNTATMILGYFFERTFNMPGFADQLSKNTEFIVSLDSMVPTSFLRHGPKVKAVESFLTEFAAYQKNRQG